MRHRKIPLLLIAVLMLLLTLLPIAAQDTATAETTQAPTAEQTQVAPAVDVDPVVVDSVQANVFDGVTAWVVIVALAGIAAIAYISKSNAALLADSVPREFATFILTGGDALVDVAGSLADKFDDYVKKTDTTLDDQALALVKNFLDGLQKRE